MDIRSNFLRQQKRKQQVADEVAAGQRQSQEWQEEFLKKLSSEIRGILKDAQVSTGSEEEETVIQEKAKISFDDLSTILQHIEKKQGE